MTARTHTHNSKMQNAETKIRYVSDFALQTLHRGSLSVIFSCLALIMRKELIPEEHLGQSVAFSNVAV